MYIHIPLLPKRGLEGQFPDWRLTPLTQYDPRWANDLYANSTSLTIRQKGCLLTCLSMALNAAGVNYWIKQDPDGNQYANETTQVLLTNF